MKQKLGVIVTGGIFIYACYLIGDLSDEVAELKRKCTCWKLLSDVQLTMLKAMIEKPGKKENKEDPEKGETE